MIRWSYVEVSVMILLIACCASISSLMPPNSAGYSIAPTPMIVPSPLISRGMECTVPIPPGLVRLIVTPAKSSAVSLLVRALRISSSYAAQNAVKSIRSQALIAATTSDRLPSSLCRSMARPRLTCAGRTTAGLPSITANQLFISGVVTNAFTIAYPMMWVKETLPPRLRRRWLLMTIRLSAISFAGTARTLEAVGTASEASMLVTTRAAAPRSVVVLASAGAVVGVLAGVGFGVLGRAAAAVGLGAGDGA